MIELKKIYIHIYNSMYRFQNITRRKHHRVPAMTKVIQSRIQQLLAIRPKAVGNRRVNPVMVI